MKKSRIPRDLKLVDRDSFIVERCKGHRVLHLGCTDSPYHVDQRENGRLLHEKLVGATAYLCGVDIDLAALTWLEENVGGDDFRVIDIENKSAMLPLRDETFEIVLLTDVLEHVSNPLIALQNIRAIAGARTRFIVSVPNAYNLKGFLRVPLGHEIVHPDHVAFHSFSTLAGLLERAGWVPESHFAYVGGGAGTAAWLANELLRRFPAWAEGIGIVARPGSAQ